QRARVASAAPLHDVGGVQALPPQDRALGARLDRTDELVQDRQLVAGSEAPPLGALGHLRVGNLGHALSMHAGPDPLQDGGQRERLLTHPCWVTDYNRAGASPKVATGGGGGGRGGGQGAASVTAWLPPAGRSYGPAAPLQDVARFSRQSLQELTPSWKENRPRYQRAVPHQGALSLAGHAPILIYRGGPRPWGSDPKILDEQVRGSVRAEPGMRSAGAGSS